MAVLSKVFAASCKGVTKTVVLSARLTFLLILVIKLAVSKLTPFNCKGVTYFDPLSAIFNFAPNENRVILSPFFIASGVT